MDLNLKRSMTETFLQGDRVSIKATVTESTRPGARLVRIAVDGLREGEVKTSRLTLVERPVVPPTDPHKYLPDPVTGEPRWQIQSGYSEGWRDVSGITFREGVWWLHAAGTSSSFLMGERAVRPVTR
jgi:hypothetical protein